jgi:hypothetical protein
VSPGAVVEWTFVGGDVVRSVQTQERVASSGGGRSAGGRGADALQDPLQGHGLEDPLQASEAVQMADGPADAAEAWTQRLSVAKEIAATTSAAFEKAQEAARKSENFGELAQGFGVMAAKADGLAGYLDTFGQTAGHASSAARHVQDTVDLILALQKSRDAASGFASNIDDPEAALKYARSTAEIFGAAAPLVSMLPSPIGSYAGKLFEVVPAIVDGFLAITDYYITRVDAKAGIYDTSQGACWLDGDPSGTPDRTGPDAQRFCSDSGYRDTVKAAGLGSIK